MKKTIDIFLIIIIFLFVYFLQTNFFMWFNIAGIMPNVFIILIMMIGLFLEKKYGFWCGLVFGLVIDFWIGSRIGIYSIALGSVGLISGFLGKTFSNSNKLNVILITTFLTALYEIIICFFTLIYGSIKNLEIMGFLKILLVEILYNNMILIIIYPMFSGFGEKLENDFKNKNFFRFLY